MTRNTSTMIIYVFILSQHWVRCIVWEFQLTALAKLYFPRVCRASKAMWDMFMIFTDAAFIKHFKDIFSVIILKKGKAVKAIYSLVLSTT